MAGTRFWPREYGDEFPVILGRAWGNMFTNESALMTCLDEAVPETYPIDEEGKSCFGLEGCGDGLVVSAGSCHDVCVGGNCGGYHNVLYVYMEDAVSEPKDMRPVALGVGLGALLAILFCVMLVHAKKKRAGQASIMPNAGKDDEEMTNSDAEVSESSVNPSESP